MKRLRIVNFNQRVEGIKFIVIRQENETEVLNSGEPLTQKEVDFFKDSEGASEVIIVNDADIIISNGLQ